VVRLVLTGDEDCFLLHDVVAAKTTSIRSRNNLVFIGLGLRFKSELIMILSMYKYFDSSLGICDAFPLSFKREGGRPLADFGVSEL